MVISDEMKKLRVLIVSQYFWPESFRINDIAKSLSEKDIEVEVLTGKPNYPQGKIFTGYQAWGCQQEVIHNALINRIPMLSRGSSRWRLALNYLSFIISGLVFAPWMLRKKKFDVIFIYGVSPILQAIPGIFLGRLKSCPVILWVQDLWPESLSATNNIQNLMVLDVVKQVVSFIYRQVDLILAQSPAFVELIRPMAATTPIIYYPNSVDDSFSAPPIFEAPEVEGLEEGFSIMFAGNIGAAQCVNVIIEAASLLKAYSDIHFVVVGDGSSRDEMLEAASQRQLVNLHLPGRFPIEKMPALMEKASVLLVTLTDQPIFAATIPNKIQAYLASGKPIIASLNGEGARVILEAHAGLASPAEDAIKLAETILILYKMDPRKREEMGVNGRQYYQRHFNHDQLINQLIEYFQGTIAGQYSH